MSERVEIPTELATRVLFASDRTCCICRNTQRKVQIHHIDGDPSNNDFDNLAVICFDCHSDAHSKVAFARNLSSDIIRLYNQSWREIVAVHLSPHGSSGTLREYTQEVLLDINLITYEWKNAYLSLHPQGWADRGGRHFKDVWEMMASDPHEYSLAEWQRYVPIFDGVVIYIIDRLERVLMVHSQVISIDVKILVLRTARELKTARASYLTFLTTVPFVDNPTEFLEIEFKEIIRALSYLADFTDQRRKALESPV
jgi:hypothetical protein